MTDEQPSEPSAYTDVAGILGAARRLRENPMFGEFEEAVEEYRRVHNTIPTPPPGAAGRAADSEDDSPPG